MPATTFRRSHASRFLDDGLDTASPGTLLVMLYDRLVLDLQRAEQALGLGNREGANSNLQHAQDIVRELQYSLDVSAWEGGKTLAALYDWLVKELTSANIAGDGARVAACRVDVVEPLADGWRQAAIEQVAAATTGSGMP